MVSTEVDDYRDSFLYSLALSAGVEVPALQLKDKAADAAIALYERWGCAARPGGKPQVAGPVPGAGGPGPTLGGRGVAGVGDSAGVSATQQEQPSD